MGWKSGVILLGVTVGSLSAAELLRVDFENRTAGAYPATLAKEDFRRSTASGQWFAGFDEGRALIVQDAQQGKALQLKYPAGCFGPNDPTACAAQVKVYLQETTHDTMWLQFKVQFESDFEFVKGGKLPGLCGSQCKTGGNIPSGDDGWSARHMWRAGGDAVQYLYYFGQPGTYGLDVPFDDGTSGQLSFALSQWATITEQVILNTVNTKGTPELTDDVGNADGKVCSWFNNELSACDSGYVFRTRDTMHVNYFYLSTFHGGSDATWAPTKDVHVRFDDFIVGTTPLKSTTTGVLRQTQPIRKVTPSVVGGSTVLLEWKNGLVNLQGQAVRSSGARYSGE